MGRHRYLASGAAHKKTKAEKIEQGAAIRDNLTKYKRIYVIQFSSTKTDYSNDVRRRFRSSTLCLSKHSILKHAIGATPEAEALPNLHQLVPFLKNNAIVFMTNEDHATVVEFFQSFSRQDFATAGQIANTTFVVPAGPLPQFTYSMDSFLLENGLPVFLDNGVITCKREHVVCNEGDVLTKKSATLLKQFGQRLATFSTDLLAYWEDGKIITPQQN